MTQTPDIWMLHTTTPREGESPWGGCYDVEADAHSDVETMRKATGLDWAVVPMVRSDSLGQCLHQIAEPGAYPDLPEPAHRGPTGTGSYFDSYTADQMHAYADATCAQRAAPQAAVSEQAEKLAKLEWIAHRYAMGLKSAHQATYIDDVEGAARNAKARLKKELTEFLAAPAHPAEGVPAAQAQIEVPNDEQAFDYHVSDCESAGIQYHGPSYERGFLTGKMVATDEAEALAATPAAPAAPECERCGLPPAEHTPVHWCDNQSFIHSNGTVQLGAAPAAAPVVLPEPWREYLEVFAIPRLERARKDAFERGDMSAIAHLDAINMGRALLAQASAAPAAPAADTEIAKLTTAYKELAGMFHDQVVAQQAAWIEWQHGKGAEEGMQWIENGLCGPGHIPEEDEPYATDAQAYFDANKSDPFPACPCGRPSNILWMGRGFCCNEHYDAARAAQGGA